MIHSRDQSHSELQEITGRLNDELQACRVGRNRDIVAPIPGLRRTSFASARTIARILRGVRGRRGAAVSGVLHQTADGGDRPYAPILFDPSVSDKMDYEVELGVVIGKAGRNIRRRMRPSISSVSPSSTT